MGLFSWLFGKRGAGAEGSAGARPTRSNRKATRARVIWREGSFPMKAVGVSSYQDVLSQICGGHNRYGHELEGDVELVRELTNSYDVNAIAVLIHGSVVGYLPREQALRVSTQMAEDGIDRATCGAKIVGGWRTNQYDEGNFGVRLALPERDWIDFGVGKKAPIDPRAKVNSDQKRKPARPEPAEDGPLVLHSVVIWGAPDTGPEAHELANLGARIMAGVGVSTTLVVQINEELTPSMQASATYKKAQERIAQGVNLEIVTMTELRKRLSQ